MKKTRFAQGRSQVDSQPVRLPQFPVAKMVVGVADGRFGPVVFGLVTVLSLLPAASADLLPMSAARRPRKDEHHHLDDAEVGDNGQLPSVSIANEPSPSAAVAGIQVEEATTLPMRRYPEEVLSDAFSGQGQILQATTNVKDEGSDLAPHQYADASGDEEEPEPSVTLHLGDRLKRILATFVASFFIAGLLYAAIFAGSRNRQHQRHWECKNPDAAARVADKGDREQPTDAMVARGAASHLHEVTTGTNIELSPGAARELHVSLLKA